MKTYKLLLIVRTLLGAKLLFIRLKVLRFQDKYTYMEWDYKSQLSAGRGGSDVPMMEYSQATANDLALETAENCWSAEPRVRFISFHISIT